ncbi:MAG: hypothetical protein K6E20_01690 [Acholeplasmatales bacterium]|nr:hypothetical protein [Acholeplasmatales bacterium]
MRYIRGCEINQIGIADDFYEAYIRCLSANANNNIVAIPAFTNGLFACELYFKCLLKKMVKNHNLKDLFDKLDEDYKKELNETKNDSGFSLDELLDKIGNGFEVWRYCFEDEHKEFEENFPFECSEVFLSIYLPALKEMAHRNNVNQ